ncbi:MAG: hypothetical protein FWC45_09640 [Treponema sp.]|nr:hypothetical protein [Treponema sp.]
MKKAVFVLLFSLTALAVFAQGTPRIYTVGILPFEATGEGVGPADAAEATRLVIEGVSPCLTLTLLQGDQAKDGEYLIKGQISRQNNQIVLTAATTEARSGRVLNTSKEQAATLAAISMFSFCAQVTDYIPYPGYLLGKWQSTINMIDGPVTCILEFRSDRTVRVQQYDTWEHNGTNILKYQAIGSGTYTFGGYHILRTITINGQRIQTHGALGVNLALEDALPRYVTVNRTGLRVVFNDSKNGFELVNAGLPCGDNFTGPSVYPSASVFYTKFTKIQ